MYRKDSTGWIKNKDYVVNSFAKLMGSEVYQENLFEDLK